MLGRQTISDASEEHSRQVLRRQSYQIRLLGIALTIGLTVKSPSERNDIVPDVPLKARNEVVSLILVVRKQNAKSSAEVFIDTVVQGLDVTTLGTLHWRVEMWLHILSVSGKKLTLLLVEMSAGLTFRVSIPDKSLCTVLRAS
jgi:hypothetical protein